MTTKNTIQLLENALQIAKTFNLKLKDNNINYQYVELKSIYTNTGYYVPFFEIIINNKHKEFLIHKKKGRFLRCNS